MNSVYHHYKDDFFFLLYFAMIFFKLVLKFKDLLTRRIWDVTGRVERFYQLWILSVGIDCITFGDTYTGKGRCHLLSFLLWSERKLSSRTLAMFKLLDPWF